jgi:hypothetical protein
MIPSRRRSMVRHWSSCCLSPWFLKVIRNRHVWIVFFFFGLPLADHCLRQNFVMLTTEAEESEKLSHFQSILCYQLRLPRILVRRISESLSNMSCMMGCTCCKIFSTAVPRILILSKFYSPTDAQENCFKRSIKIHIETAPTCFGVITIIKERTIWAC